MNAHTRRPNRRSPLQAMALAAAVSLGSAAAMAQAPSDAEIGDCSARAERYFASQELTVREAEAFHTANGSRVLALDLALGQGVQPRFYCTLASDGQVRQVHSMPRLPGHEDPMVVSK